MNRNTSRIDTRVLHEYKAKKLVKCQRHPTKDLYIWNYTDQVQMHGPWDDVTSLTRGLVTDNDGVIKGRSFRKFHNIDEGKFVPTERFKVYEKLDGSLGILFWHEDEWVFCSRGSFTSDQALFGRHLLETKYSLDGLEKKYSYSFEIIYPQNRIVVDYKDKEELVFLAAFLTETGEEIVSYESVMRECGFPCVKTYDGYYDYTELRALNWENSEGFVVVFENGDRVKIKFEDYLKLHRKVTNLNALRIWEWYSEGRDMDECIEYVPDEFYEWIKKQWDQLDKQYNDIYEVCHTEYMKLKGETNTRPEFAKKAVTHQHAKILFDFYNMKDVFGSICKLIKPIDGTYNTPYGGKLTGVQKQTFLNGHKKQQSLPSITILVGISASGKSTWARDVLAMNRGVYVRVSRDDIRKQLFGYMDENIGEYYEDAKKYNEHEKTVTKLEYAMIDSALKEGKNVLVDNTNLQKTYINGYLKAFPYNDVSFKVFDDVDIDECIKRDAMRTGGASVGETVLRKQAKYLKQLKSGGFSFDTRKGWVVKQNMNDDNDRVVGATSSDDKLICLNTFNNHSEIVAPTTLDNDKKPKCYIFDIDGTLANNDHRQPYDYLTVCYDSVYEDVRETLISLKKQGYGIVICTGRDAVCEDMTKEWLQNNGIEYDAFMCRPRGDGRPDWVVKEEMWNEIVKSYTIVAMFDDRDCVVKHARFLGFRVYQVNYGDF